jgi:hypothetical protein
VKDAKAAHKARSGAKAKAANADGGEGRGGEGGGEAGPAKKKESFLSRLIKKAIDNVQVTVQVREGGWGAKSGGGGGGGSEARKGVETNCGGRAAVCTICSVLYCIVLSVL